MEPAGETRYFRSAPGGAVRCELCCHTCVLGEGVTGFCGVRQARGGKVINPLGSTVSSIAIDPIEKKPLYEFLPGTRTFSVGFWHCTFHCPFCQNWQIAHPSGSPEVLPRSASEIVEAALSSGCPSLSFTYSEPTLHIEFVMECMDLARRRGLKTILVTNGNLLPAPARDILSRTDAVNADLKTSSDSIYRSILHGSLKVVQNFIQIAAELTHIEVSSLLVPGVLDSPDQMKEIAAFIAGIDPSMPLHITPYYPAYEWNLPAISSAERRKIAEPASRLLRNVYFH